MNLVKIAVCFLNQWQTRQAARWMKGRHAEVVGGRRRRSRHAGNAQTSGSRQNGRRLWREGFWLVGALGGGGARARPPVFPRTMPNGAFVKVSSFTADAARAPRVSDYRSLVRFAPIEGRQKAAELLSHSLCTEDTFISIHSSITGEIYYNWSIHFTTTYLVLT